MNARPVSECDACRQALTELVCDELDEQTRASVADHARHCEGCAAELARMRAVMQAADSLPMDAPSPRVRVAVMLAAREAQARRALLAAAPAAPEPGPFAQLLAWLTRLGTWAMSPQVAMASVLLLMLGIGLVALPLGEEREPVALRAAEEPTAPPAAAATATAAPPAAPPAQEETVAARQTEREVADGPEEQATKGGATQQRGPSADNTALSGLRRGAARTRDEGRADDGPSMKKQASERVAPGAPALAEAARAFPSPAAQASGSAISEREAFAPAPPPPSDRDSTQAAEAAETAPEPKVTASSSEAQLLAQGVRAVRAGDHRSAISVLKPLADHGSVSVRSDAALWLARGYRAAGDCTSALRYYGPLAASSTASATTLNEAADCYDRSGKSQTAAAFRARVAKGRTTKAARPNAASPAATPAEKD